VTVPAPAPPPDAAGHRFVRIPMYEPDDVAISLSRRSALAIVQGLLAAQPFIPETVRRDFHLALRAFDVGLRGEDRLVDAEVLPCPE